ncbi:hypothetical protein ACQJBY_029430 [Aegilops geniculata]
MAPPPLDDLTHLLAEVASRLSRPPGGAGPSSVAGDSLSASVSSLAAALNPRAAAPASSGTRVLDAALSLMCFDPQEVDRARLDCLVRTAVSALSDPASCRVARTDDRAEMLCVGSSVSPRDCRELVRSCAALVEKLGGRDAAGHSYDLLHAAVKTALLSPRYQCLFPSPYYREDGESSCEMGTISLDVTTHPSYQVLPNDGSVPPRYAWALLWHYDPSILKHDLSEMLREAITRPLLCMRKELHDRGYGFCARTLHSSGIISIRYSSRAYGMGNIHRTGTEISLYTCLFPKPTKGLTCHTNWNHVMQTIFGSCFLHRSYGFLG